MVGLCSSDEDCRLMLSSLSTDERQRQNKKHQLMYGTLADTVVRELMLAGCDRRQLVDFASEVLRTINQKGFGSADGWPDISDTCQRRRPIPWRVKQSPGGLESIRGPRVTLRPLRPEDATRLAIWRQDREIRPTFAWCLLHDLARRAARKVSSSRRVDLVICDEQHRRIGAVSLFGIDRRRRRAEFGKLVGDRAARGRGYAREASSLLLAYAFSVLKLRRVSLRTVGFNLHNIRLNERMGFKFEGILRQADHLNNQLVDVVLMSMLDREFFQWHEPQQLA